MVSLDEFGDVGVRRGGPGRAFMASRRRRSSAGLGSRATDKPKWPPASPLWGMGGPSEPCPKRVTATGEPCRRARGLAPGPGVAEFVEAR
jgi:hypothetical protein